MKCIAHSDDDEVDHDSERALLEWRREAYERLELAQARAIEAQAKRIEDTDAERERVVRRFVAMVDERKMIRSHPSDADFAGSRH